MNGVERDLCSNGRDLPHCYMMKSTLVCQKLRLVFLHQSVNSSIAKFGWQMRLRSGYKFYSALNNPEHKWICKQGRLRD